MIIFSRCFNSSRRETCPVRVADPRYVFGESAVCTLIFAQVAVEDSWWFAHTPYYGPLRSFYAKPRKIKILGVWDSFVKIQIKKQYSKQKWTLQLQSVLINE